MRTNKFAMLVGLLGPFLIFACLLVPAYGQQADAAADDQKNVAVNQSGQSEKQINQTLQSFKKLDDHPLFEMHFHGDYVADAPRLSLLENQPEDTAWACSLFVTTNADGSILYGRNFDWFYNPALLLHTNPSNGYASISMVDISYLGFERKDKKYDSIKGRKALLMAPLLPFDGMNEHGLTVGMAAVDDTKVPMDPTKPTVGSLQIIRLMLDRAKTVDEALALFEEFNIKTAGGPMIHYLIADATGKSALVELKDGKTNILRGERTWQSATNFYLTGEKNPLQRCIRFSKIHRLMNDKKDGLSVDQSFNLLKNISQQSTRWSVVYDLKNQSAQVAMSRNFGKRYSFEVKSQTDSAE